MTKRDLKEYNAAGADLKQMRQPYEAHFKELADHFSPRRSRFNRVEGGGDSTGKQNVNRKILNSRPRFALRTMQSGMHAGITSPARPWFRLTPVDPGLRERAEVKQHFSDAQREMRQMLQSSGMYSVIHTLWGDLGLYGYDVGIMEDSDKFGIFGQAVAPGEAWIAANSEHMVDTMYRETRMTVQQIVKKFVYKGDASNTPDWTVCSTTVKRMWDNGNRSERVPVRHLITPRMERDARLNDGPNKPIMSAYWEGEESGGLLGDLGYDENPVIASRWDAVGSETYAISPAMDTLADAKELQRKERDKAEAIRRMNRPPMNAPTELRNSPYSLLPEAVNFVADPTKGMVPAIQVTPPLQHMLEDIRVSEDRVNEGMYANLFMMLANLDRRQITAREVDERHEEKLLGLGPVLERQHKEKLSRIIGKLYTVVAASDRVAPLPEEFDAIPVKITYTSTLAQAQKAVATGGIERLYAFAGNLSAVDGSVMDNLDNDVAVEEYADMIGVSSNIVRPNDRVIEIREQRQQQVQQQQQADAVQQGAEIANTGAQAAKVLSETDGGRSPRSTLLRQLGITG